MLDTVDAVLGGMVILAVVGFFTHRFITKWRAKRDLAKNDEKRHRKTAEEKYGWSTKTPCCHKIMFEEVQPLRFRDTVFGWHYLCGCGVALHYRITMLPTLHGYGRWRLVSHDTTLPNARKYVPNRLLSSDRLWYAPETGIYYFFKGGILLSFTKKTLPPFRGEAPLITNISPGHRIKTNNRFYIFNGLCFVEPSIFDIEHHAVD